MLYEVITLYLLGSSGRLLYGTANELIEASLDEENNQKIREIINRTEGVLGSGELKTRRIVITSYSIHYTKLYDGKWETGRHEAFIYKGGKKQSRLQPGPDKFPQTEELLKEGCFRLRKAAAGHTKTLYRLKLSSLLARKSPPIYRGKMLFQLSRKTWLQGCNKFTEIV